jgi:hypothetical protein
MERKFVFFAITLLLVNVTLKAQTDDFGIWASAAVEKSLGKLNLGAEAELRTKDNASQTDRASIQVSADYDIFKPLKAGLAYQFIDYYDSKYADYQPRHRFIMYLQGKYKLGDFTFTLRERAQMTTKDESDRIKTSGKKKGSIDTYKVNPEWTWRNRFKATYNIPHFPVNPSIAVETFYELNNPDGNVFDKVRYTLSFGYNITKHHQLDVFGLIDKEINVTDPVTTYITGVGYTYSF